MRFSRVHGRAQKILSKCRNTRFATRHHCEVVAIPPGLNKKETNSQSL
jgi:hypothetical protein